MCLGEGYWLQTKGLFFSAASSSKGKLSSLSKLGVFSLEKALAIKANTYIALDLKGEFYTGDNQKCSQISFFLKQKQSFINKFRKLSYLHCFPFQRRGRVPSTG